MSERIRVEVERLAHGCAGSSASCGIVGVVATFRSMEQAGKSGAFAEAARGWDEAHAMLERVQGIRDRVAPPADDNTAQ